MYINEIISKINSWNDFKSLLETKTKLEKGLEFSLLSLMHQFSKSQIQNLFQN